MAEGMNLDRGWIDEGSDAMMNPRDCEGTPLRTNDIVHHTGNDTLYVVTGKQDRQHFVRLRKLSAHTAGFSLSPIEIMYFREHQLRLVERPVNMHERGRSD